MVRVKQRYIICEFLTPLTNAHVVLSFKDKDLASGIRCAVEKLHGDYGAAMINQSLRVVYFNKYTRMAIIRAKRGFHNMVIQSMAFIKQILGLDIIIRTLHIAGTVRSCQKFIIRFHQQHLPHLLSNASSAEEKKCIADSTDLGQFCT